MYISALSPHRVEDREERRGRGRMEGCSEQVIKGERESEKER